MVYPASDEDPFDMEDIGFVPHVKNLPRSKKSARPRQPRNVLPKVDLAPIIEEQEEDKFQISYHAARHEAVWLRQSLEYFFDQKWFLDVLRMVKGGKEASVYLCTGNPTTGLDLLAAKVYRPRMFRNLKNDWLYREGRANLDESGNQVTNKGKLHAIHKKTEYGRELMHTSWLEHEYKTLELLHNVGADVPRALASDSNAILMEYFGDEVMGAPTLNDVSLSKAEARTLFDRVMHNIELMLANGRIHGDLSAFNILYWEGDIAIIDFPQAINPHENRSAYRIFERDVVRICEYFQRQGVKLGERVTPHKLSADLWMRYNYDFVPQINPKAISEDEDDDRDLWESLKNA